jgi:hypothetical protein
MDSANDLLMTAMKGSYAWDALVPFVHSLDRSGFRGTKLIQVHGITDDVRSKLLEHGFTVLDYVIDEPRVFGSYCSERFWPANGFLKAHAHEYRYIIWVDWKDLVVQTTPSSWLEKHALLCPTDKIIGCGEGLLAKEEFYNNGWLKQAADPEGYSQAREYQICCAGTIAGEAQAMRDLLCDIFHVLSTSPNKPDYAGGVSPLIDQGVLNHLLYTKYRSCTRVPRPEDAFVATCNWYLVHRWRNRCVPTLGADGMIYPSGSTVPFSIVHQYDRDPAWKEAVQNRYR